MEKRQAQAIDSAIRRSALARLLGGSQLRLGGRQTAAGGRESRGVDRVIASVCRLATATTNTVGGSRYVIGAEHCCPILHDWPVLAKVAASLQQSWPLDVFAGVAAVSACMRA